jgi:hypothetical protein
MQAVSLKQSWEVPWRMLLLKAGLVPTRMVAPKMAFGTLLGRSRITWCNICREITIMLVVPKVRMAKTAFRLSESEPDSYKERVPARINIRYNPGTTRLNCNQKIRHNNKLRHRISMRLQIRTNRISLQMFEY